jgi:hypothetical protein
MQFEIHTGDNIKACKLQDLSRSILVNSEVYIVEGEKKRLVGISSGKTIAYLSAEFSDYALNNYTNLGELDALPIKNCINLVRKWIENSSSVSEEELKAAAEAAAEAAAGAAAEAARAAAGAAARAAGAAARVAVGATAGVAWAAENAALAAGASSSAIGSDKDARIKAEKNELERQGIFILDFFKTEKNMFLM